MKNLDIYINGSRAVYDDKTLVGSILQNFDFTDPSNRKQAYTNSLKLPVDLNQHIFEFASEPGYVGTIPYDRVSVEIIVDGWLLLKNGIGYINDVKDGYYILSIREQPDIIQTMKDTTLDTLGASQSLSTPYAQDLLNSTSNFKLDFIMNEASRVYSVSNPANFKHFIATNNLTYYIHSLFSSFATANSITFAGGLMTDTYFLNMRMIVEKGVVSSIPAQVYYQSVNSEKSFFELFKAVLQMFGAVYTISGSTITIDKLDNKVSISNAVSWKNKLQKITSKKFTLENLSQNNYMRFKTGGEAEEYLNQALWTSSNKNISGEGNIIEPNVTVYPFVSLAGLITSTTTSDKAIYLPDSSFGITNALPGVSTTVDSSITDFVFVVDSASAAMPTGTLIEMEYIVPYPASGYGTSVSSFTLAGTDNVALATYYNSQNDYQLFEAMIDYPLMYEAEFDLNVLDLHNFDPFNLVIVPELAGEFYVNKLQYNFEKGGRASKVSLIKYVEP